MELYKRENTQENFDALGWLSWKQIVQLEIECHSLIYYLQQRKQHKRVYKKLLFTRIARIKQWFAAIEMSLQEEEHTDRKRAKDSIEEYPQVQEQERSAKMACNQ